METVKIKIKKKCGECSRIRPVHEFTSTNSSCNYCSQTVPRDGIWQKCYMCNLDFQPTGRYNKICEHCKRTDAWSTVLYNVEV